MEKSINKHKETFGVEPIDIGMFWDNPIQYEENIKQAIKDNKPYNEYEMLTKEEQKAFDKGELLF